VTSPSSSYASAVNALAPSLSMVCSK
jgi:hypothetical protein